MAEILRAWLNDTVVLSRPVLDIDRDFASGELLVDLLERLHQLPAGGAANAGGADTPAAQVARFVAAEPAVRALGIPYDSRVVAAVVAGKPGAATKLVFQVRTAMHARGVRGQADGALRAVFFFFFIQWSFLFFFFFFFFFCDISSCDGRALVPGGFVFLQSPLD
jgi:hypothetical protein